MPDLPENHPDFLSAYLKAERGQHRPRKRRARGQPAGDMARLLHFRPPPRAERFVPA